MDTKSRYQGIKLAEGGRSCDSDSNQSKLSLKISNSEGYFKSFPNQFQVIVHSNAVDQSTSNMSSPLNEPALLEKTSMKEMY